MVPCREGVVMGLFRGMNSTTLRESTQQAIYFATVSKVTDTVVRGHSKAGFGLVAVLCCAPRYSTVIQYCIYKWYSSRVQ